MINFEEFKNLINDYKNHLNNIDNASDALNLSLYDSKIVSYSLEIFNKLIECYFNKIASEDIDWWLYEKSSDPSLKMFDESGQEIPSETIEDLWNLIKGNRK